MPRRQLETHLSSHSLVRSYRARRNVRIRMRVDTQVTHISTHLRTRMDRSKRPYVANLVHQRPTSKKWDLRLCQKPDDMTCYNVFQQQLSLNYERSSWEMPKTYLSPSRTSTFLFGKDASEASRFGAYLPMQVHRHYSRRRLPLREYIMSSR